MRIDILIDADNRAVSLQQPSVLSSLSSLSYLHATHPCALEELMYSVFVPALNINKL